MRKKKSENPPVTLQEARNNKFKMDWKTYSPIKPSFLGAKSFSVPLNELVDFIDWSPFFQSWELAGNYPKIFDDPVIGESAKNLFYDAKNLLNKIIQEKWLEAKAVVGFFPANSVEDDIEVYSDDNRKQVLTTFRMLRQQSKKTNKPNLCLADFIAPKSSGTSDYLGGFAVTSGIGLEKYVTQFEKNHDEYNSILLKALADRLAEALAEYMHAKVRKTLWGYIPEEHLTNEDLIAEKYRGIRPAPGYPACPDHTEKPALFALLKATENASMNLTENFAMQPASSVSGFYFSHPESQYFGIGKIEEDQVKDYAKRKEMDLQIIKRWLAPNL